MQCPLPTDRPTQLAELGDASAAESGSVSAVHPTARCLQAPRQCEPLDPDRSPHPALAAIGQRPPLSAGSSRPLHRAGTRVVSVCLRDRAETGETLSASFP